jgi:glycosyltransferase involved in cell wall biosynthesis
MLSQGLAARGHEVTIAAPRGSILASRAREAGLETFEEADFRKPKHLVTALRDVRALERHLRRQAYAIIDAHGSQDLWSIVLARRRAGDRTPLVFTRHNTKHVAAHLANRWLLRQIDHLILASASILDRYAPFLDAGVLRRDQISVVHSAYRPDRFHAGVDGSRVREDMGVAEDAPLVGVVGRLVEDKGQDDFLRAAAIVRRRHPRALFVLVGTGTADPSLRALASRLDLTDAARFLGFREDVPEITAALDVSVLPSVDCDASSAALKEALACGVPVVATDIGGASEIVRQGETGLIVPPRSPERLASAIQSLLEDPPAARAMGARGRAEMPARFSPDRLTEETLLAYQAVLARRRT